uniref:Uncharacterized protein n=1 Tax=Balaenoptera musculus TaxID=9771 RepID=A0A8C0CIH1_BALMU
FNYEGCCISSIDCSGSPAFSMVLEAKSLRPRQYAQVTSKGGLLLSTGIQGRRGARATSGSASASRPGAHASPWASLPLTASDAAYKPLTPLTASDAAYSL